MKGKFYITTAIAYTNSNPHLGFALELVEADALARYKRQKGYDVFFLTGTDEHGKKIADSAKKAGKEPKAFVDEVSEKFKELAKRLNISNDFFIRTSDQEVHYPVVLDVWKRLKDNGDIYENNYEGLYCSGCEAFLSLKELENGLCKIHKKEPEKISEKNYFFRLSKYADKVYEKLKNDEIKILPKFRKNEVLNLFSENIEDISFSRPKESVSWGIDVFDDPSQKIYVWADALVNYISGLGGFESERFKKYWPADVHLIGKDILRFHAIIWPAMLIALQIPLPKNIYVHGFITHNGEKMSKSLGNVVDPFDLLDNYPVDALRYYLLREIPSYDDGDFSDERFKERYDDLANRLGNLVMRFSALAEKHKDKLKINFSKESDFLKDVIVRNDIYFENFELNKALALIFDLIIHTDKLIEENRVWELVKLDEKRFSDVMNEIFVNIMNVAWLIYPFLPETGEKILRHFGLSINKDCWEKEILNFKKMEPLFPKLD